MATLPCLKEPMIPVRVNRRHDVISMTKMNGENLIRLRHRRTSEFGRVVRSWNMQLNRQLKRNVNLWFSDKNTALANCSKSQKRVYNNLNHYHSELRRIKREEHIKEQERIREALERLRIKRIVRKVVDKFRENVYRKKALRIARRRSKRGTISRLKSIKENNVEHDDGGLGHAKTKKGEDSADAAPDASSSSQLTVENVAKLSKIYEEAKRGAGVENERDNIEARRGVCSSKYLEVRKGDDPQTKIYEVTKEVEISRSEQMLDSGFAKPGDLPPLKLIRRSHYAPPQKAALLENLQNWHTEQVLSMMIKANEPPKFISEFEPIHERNGLEDGDLDVGRSVSKAEKQSAITEGVVATSSYKNGARHKSSLSSMKSRQGLANIDAEENLPNPVKGRKTKQSILNRQKRKEDAILRNWLLNEELPIAYVRTESGDIVESEVRPKRTVFENHAGKWKYQRDKLKMAEKDKTEKRNQQLNDFYHKLSDRSREISQKSVTKPHAVDEEQPQKTLRRPSLSISALLNRPFNRQTEEDVLKSCSYIREYEPVLSEEHREMVRQRKRSSWQLPALDQTHLTRLHQFAMSHFN